jgi:DNA-binding winged helix-turn-helix (wHTH) protein
MGRFQGTSESAIKSTTMENSQAGEGSLTADFRIGGWLVQPRLNRLSRGERVLQIEPKMMDVLVYLAHNAGEVVSKNDIIDAVWPDLFITESVISRAIAGLRRTLEDDARHPRFIETILKRGYRLIAEVSPASEVTDGRPTSVQPRRADLRRQAPPVPFVVGQWVRGETFYGRKAQIGEILEGNRNWLWVLGTRRIGKTSLLKQLEQIAAASPELGFVPLFWDLQGADTPEDLHVDFGEALLDAEQRLEDAGIRLTEVRTEDLFDSLGRLRRQLSSKNLKLLLLCDEVEELIQLNQKEPALLRKLRRAMQSQEAVRSVLASSGRLWQLAGTGGDTSPFLDGFTPPLYLGALEDDEARALILQEALPPDARPEFTDEQVERIRTSCGNHPYLIHLLCRRALDEDDLDRAIEGVAADRAVSFFCAVDFDLLSETERAALRILAEAPGASASSIADRLPELAETLPASLEALQRLGLVRHEPADRFSVANEFLRRWLQSEASRT